MTTPATPRRAGPFPGNGTQTAFPFTFRVFSATDVKVLLAGSDSVETEVPTAGYSVTINADQETSPGGTVNLVAAPALGATLAVVGGTPYSQTLDLPNGGAFSPRAVENAFDRTVFQIQQLAEAQARALSLPATGAGASTTLPPPVAGNVIGWDEAGLALRNIDAATLASIVAYADKRTLVADGGAPFYTLASDPGNASNTLVAVGGVVQTPGVDYTVSGVTLTPTTAWPDGTDNVVIIYGGALPVGTAAAASVTWTAAGTGALPRTAEDRFTDVAVATDYASLQAAITANYNRRLYVPAGTYALSAQLDIAGPIEIDLDPHAILDFSALPAGTGLGQRHGIRAQGSTVGSDIAITANVARGSAVLQVASTATLAANAWIMVRSNDLYSPGAAPGLQTLGHFARIRSVDSATQVTLWTRSPFAYTAASNARVTRLALLGGVTIRGGQIVMGGVGSVHTGIRFDFCLNPRVIETQIAGGEDTGVMFSLCVNPTVERPIIINSTSPGGAIGNTGYGVAVYASEGGSLTGGYFFNCRHSVSGGTGPGFIPPRGFTTSKTYSFACGLNTWALDCHEPCIDWSFIGNTVVGGSGGIVLRGPGAKAIGNTISDVLGSGIYLGQFQNNTDGTPAQVVTGNVISNPGTYGIHVVGNNVAGDRVRRALVKDNSIRGSAGHGVLVQHAVGLDLSGTVVADVGGTFQGGIYIQNSAQVTVMGGTIEMTAAANGNAVFVENSDRTRLVGLNMVGNASATTQDAIRANASSSQQGLIVSACTAQSFGRYGLYTTNTDRVIATSNDMRDVVSGTKILISGATTSVNVDNIV